MLMWKAALLAPVAIACVSATPAPPETYRQLVNYPLVHQVLCLEGKGTAFRVGRTRFLSVAHVTTMHGCAIDGVPIIDNIEDRKNDFSAVDVPTPKLGGFKVNCDGFIPGQWYHAIGYAWGLPVQTSIAVYATYLKAPGGKRVLIGPYTVIPGMSGGPVLNSKGEVVGLVNAYLPGTALSFSRELKDTEACHA
jgi:hypothetical protein